MGLSKLEQAEMVMAALDGRHQPYIHCYCDYYISAGGREYQDDKHCLLCDRRWRRAGNEYWSYWHLVDKKGRKRHGRRGKSAFVPGFGMELTT